MPAPLSRRDWLRAASAAAGGLLISAYRPLAAQEARQAALLVRSAEPLNAEPDLARLVAARTTPVADFYIRNHGPLPKLDEDGYKLRVEGLVHRPRDLTMAELKCAIVQRQEEATLTCAGNRRREMAAVKPIAGVQWDAGAIGHASWVGALLVGVLEMAEIKPEAKHVWFEGHDPITEKDGSVAPFGGSIPLARALDTAVPVILAHTMNDKPLAAEHGFPLRAVVPGYIGARSVKWLAKLVVSDRPSPNHYLAAAYKLVGTDDKTELAKAEPIYQFPINSAICTPAAGAKLKAGQTTVAGYALPPGDGKSTIAKVELSIDGGRTWQKAELAGQSAPCCWRLWHVEVVLPAGKHEFVVRATDSAGRLQPEKCDWNLKGYLYNAWHRVGVEAT